MPKCSLCESTALYKTGKGLFCLNHKHEATASLKLADYMYTKAYRQAAISMKCIQCGNEREYGKRCYCKYAASRKEAELLRGLALAKHDEAATARRKRASLQKAGLSK